MLSIAFWRRYINITNTILDIIRRPVFYLKYNLSQTGFYLRLEMDGDRDKLYLFGPNK
jgi:hypothetical protein